MRFMCALVLALAAQVGVFAAQGGASVNATNIVKVPAPANSITTTWTTVIPPNSNQWNNVAYGNGTFVAVSSSGTGNRVMTSNDGLVWTARTSAADNSWYGVCYGNGLFVATSTSGTGNRVMTSPDGITWTARTSAEDNPWYSVCFGYDTSGRGIFVAVAQSGTNQVMTSYDGITWTVRTAANANQWSAVCYGNSLFVAVSNSGTGNRVMTSPDGIAWTERTSAADNNWYGVTFGNGLYVAVAYSGTGNRVMTSSNGTAWSTQTSSSNSSWYKITYASGVFAAIGPGNNKVMYSTDGTTWAETNYPTGGANGITYGNGMLIGVYTDKVGVSGQQNVNVVNQVNSNLSLTDMSGKTAAIISNNLQPAFTNANQDGMSVYFQTPGGNGATNKGGDIIFAPGAAASTGYPGQVVFNNLPWDDSMSSSISLRDTGVNIPALTQYTNGGDVSGMYFPDYEEGDFQVFSIQMPHSIKVGSELHPHIHVMTAGGTNTNAVTFTLTYQVRNIGGTYGAATSANPLPADPTMSHTSVITITPNAGVHQIGEFTELTPALLTFDPNVSCIMAGNIARTATGGTDFNGNVFLLAFDIHFTKDTLGSRKELSK